ncbi:TolC family outer membrane protein [Alcanivorax quisquiliarum]|uniref:TolC family outer membrane protein n=1 Tax=Alcanivorax quisquiliarum TaxID=2933565 RepID=A0ABT0EA39_9GAMM|nr:TolC family outer membrane protein [Alcanivorax quisquiliarum]MCK0538691.1 TolC family outer membrane protein [Alcanivorax quisquiliarum]
MRTTGLSIAAAAALALAVTGTAHSATLADVLESAWQADSQWSGALRTWEAEQETLVQGRSGLLPSVHASYAWLDNDIKLTSSPGGETDFETETLTVSLVQPLFRPGAWYAYKQADAATSLAAANFQQARQDFLLRVAQQYFGVLQSWENLVSIRAEERAIGRQLEQTRERFDVGLVAVTDVHEAEAVYDLTRVERILAEADFDIARDRLEALTGRSWESLAALQEDLPLDGPQPAEPQQWVEMARQQNPTVLAALYQAETARHFASQRAWDHGPTVDLVAQHQRYKNDASGPIGTLNQPDTRTNAYGIEVNLPLFQGGGINSRRKQAALQHEASQDRYQQAWRDVGQQTLGTYRLVSANALRISARAQAIRSAESALEATQAGYEVGTRNIVDVLNAQRTLFAARRDYANARYEYILDSLGLKALSGVLAEDDLMQVNAWLSPADLVELDAVAGAGDPLDD